MPTAEQGSQYHWPSAGNAALAEVLRNLFTGKQNSIAAFGNLEAQPRELVRKLGQGVDLGHTVGDAVAAWIAGDGFAQLNNYPY